MKNPSKPNKSCIIATILTSAILALAFRATKTNAQDGRAPEVPSPVCDIINVPAGNEVAFHAYAIGVQIYRWNGSAWVFLAPVANLYANANYDGQIGTHYAGPTWESNSGSKVVGRRLQGCTPDSSAIPWLLLQKVTSDGPGIFNAITYIQRVNTIGGIAPSTPGSFTGEEQQVPYTAEYFFYRAVDEE
jgi:hypothetical protein